MFTFAETMFLMRVALLILWMCTLCCVSSVARVSDKEGCIGLAVIKDACDPTDYFDSRFLKNPVSHIPLERVQMNEEDVSSLLNMLNVGKQVLNYLLNYNLGEMDNSRLIQRVAESKPANGFTDEDFRSAIINNYFLVVKLDKDSERRAMRGDTLGLKPKGKWFLYQLVCDDETFSKVKASKWEPDDDPKVKGSKRVAYEGITLPIRLVSSGDDISGNAMRRVLERIRYVSAADVRKGRTKTNFGKTGMALRLVLSPVIILKK